MKRYYLAALAALLLFGCGASKTELRGILQREILRSDSLEYALYHQERLVDTVDRIITQADRLETIIAVQVDCDSTGQVKPARAEVFTSRGSAVSEIQDGRLRLRLELDSVRSEIRREFRGKYVADSSVLHSRIYRQLREELSLELRKKSTPAKTWIGFSLWILIAAAAGYLVGRYTTFKIFRWF